MKMMPALTVAALVLAVVASVFAIWASVADAPWEDGGEIIVVNEVIPQPESDTSRDDARCTEALRDRELIRRSMRVPRMSDELLSANQRRLDFAQDDVDFYC